MNPSAAEVFSTPATVRAPSLRTVRLPCTFCSVTVPFTVIVTSPTPDSPVMVPRVSKLSTDPLTADRLIVPLTASMS